METLMLMGIVGLTGYYLQDKSGRKKEGISNVNNKDDIMMENEKPNSLNIYNSNKVNASNDELLRMSLNNYKDAENPSLTGILPPIYNSYSAMGNETILNTNIKEKNLSETNDINRRSNVLKTPNVPVIDRPMFKLSNLGATSDDNYSNFGTGELSNQEVSLLSGKVIEREHSNMVPFFGSNIKQNVETFTNESKLDNYTGNTSTFIHKQERSPQFKQVSQNIYGAPLLTDHIDTSRYIPSAYRQNEKPFYEEQVSAPISGTVSNPLNNVRQPTIDSLRTANNQQVSYEGRTKVGQMGSVRGITGDVAKNNPDTHFELGHERLFTSTGAIIKNKSSNNYENMMDTSRQNQNLEYYGGAMSNELLSAGPRLKGISEIDNTSNLDFSSIFQDPRRNQLSSDTQRNIGSKISGVNDYGKNSINLLELERDTTNDQHTLNINKSSSGQRIGIQDNIKGTLKETLLEKQDNSGNIRTKLKGDSGMTDYTFKTTNKETLVEKNGKYNGHVNKKDGMGYNVVNAFAKTTNKEITSDHAYSGHANDSNKNAMIYSTFENPEKVRNAVHVENYQGVGNHHTSAAENRIKYKNAEISESKEKLLQGQRPNGRTSSLGVAINSKDILGRVKITDNMLLKEKSKKRVENLNFTNNIPSKNLLGEQQEKHNNQSEVQNNRINLNDISMQLNNNPFFNLK